MWDLVLTVRQQLQWEFSNAYVVKKTTTTIGSQRLHQRLEKEKLSEQVLFRTQYVLLPQVSTTWWRKCRWTSMSHPCLRWTGHLNTTKIMFCLFWNASLKTDLFSDTFLVGRGKTQPAPQVRNQNLQSRFLWLILFSGRGWSMLVCLWLTMTSTSCHETSSTSSGLCPLLVA